MLPLHSLLARCLSHFDLPEAGSKIHQSLPLGKTRRLLLEILQQLSPYLKTRFVHLLFFRFALEAKYRRRLQIQSKKLFRNNFED